MKKLFTLIAACMLTLNCVASDSNGSNVLSVGEPGNNTTSKTDDGTELVWYDSDTKTITFHSSWSYRPGWWLAWNNETQANTGNDYSDYDQFVVELESAVDYTIQVMVEYMDGSNSSATGKGPTISVDLSDKKDSVKQVYLQSSTADVTAVFKDAYFKSNSASSDTTSTETVDLPMDEDNSLNTGWSSSYTASNKTITYESAWTGRGWWLGGKDLYTDYEKVVVEFETSPMAVQLVVENYPEGATGGDIPKELTGTSYVSAGSTKVEFTFTENEKNCAQIYIQAAEAGSLVLTKAYYVKRSTTGISTINKNVATDVLYNLAGQAVSSDYKGIVVSNGKKFIKK